MSWRRRLVPSLPFRSETLTIAVKKQTKLDITFLTSCPVLLYFFSLCQIFWLGLWFNPLNANLTKWSNTLKNSLITAENLFKCVCNFFLIEIHSMPS